MEYRLHIGIRAKSKPVFNADRFDTENYKLEGTDIETTARMMAHDIELWLIENMTAYEEQEGEE